MFGYIRPFKPEMKFVEYDAYRSVYCALCKQLGERYGWAARMTLSYDGTFLAMIGIALSDAPSRICKGRCTCNPLKKCAYYHGDEDAVTYAAAVNVLLSAARCRDALADARGWKRWRAWGMLQMLRRAERKACAELPELYDEIACQLEAQQALERASCAVLDEAAEPTARMLEAILRRIGHDDTQQRILAVVGYQLGRWIYLADALDDYADDCRTGSYNPLRQRFGSDADANAVGQYAREVLSADEARLGSAFALLEPHRLGAVLNHIICEGLPAIRKQLPLPHRKQNQEAPHERPL